MTTLATRTATFRALTTAVVAFALLAVFGTAQAALVNPEAVATPNTNDEPSPGDLGTAVDYDGDGVTFDTSFGDTGSGAGGTNSGTGDKPSGNDVQLLVAVAEFDVSDPSDKTTLSNAWKIQLTLDVSNILGNPDFDIVGFAFDTNATQDGDVAADDGHTSATQLLGSFAAADLSIGDTISFDVTSAVKDDISNNYTYSGFRFAPAVVGNAVNDNGERDEVFFDEATLSTVIPEPTTLALLALGGLALLRRRTGVARRSGTHDRVVGESGMACGAFLVLLVAMLATPPGHADIVSGLIGHWTYDDATGTASENVANPGTGDGTLSTKNADAFTFDDNSSRGNRGVTHKVGSGALRFDATPGQGDYITMGTDIQIPESMTISAWVNIDSFPGKSDGSANYFQVLNRMGTGDDRGTISAVSATAADASSGSILLRQYDSANNGEVVSDNDGTAPVTTGEWHHLVFAREDQNQRLYVDGVLAELGTETAPWQQSSIALAVGMGFYSDPSVNPGNNRFSDGLIDDVRLYNRVLTDGGLTAQGQTAGGDVAELYAFIPEPTTLALLALGGLALFRRPRRR